MVSIVTIFLNLLECCYCYYWFLLFLWSYELLSLSLSWMVMVPTYPFWGLEFRKATNLYSFAQRYLSGCCWKLGGWTSNNYFDGKNDDQWTDLDLAYFQTSTRPAFGTQHFFLFTSPTVRWRWHPCCLLAKGWRSPIQERRSSVFFFFDMYRFGVLEHHHDIWKTVWCHKNGWCSKNSKTCW